MYSSEQNRLVAFESHSSHNLVIATHFAEATARVLLHFTFIVMAVNITKLLVGLDR